MAQIPRADPGPICPLHKADVSTVCHTCPWWTLIIGKHPQSEELINDWRCAIAVLPVLMVENSQQSRATGEAVETLRNELVKGMERANQIALTNASDPLLINGR